MLSLEHYLDLQLDAQGEKVDPFRRRAPRLNADISSSLKNLKPKAFRMLRRKTGGTGFYHPQQRTSKVLTGFKAGITIIVYEYHVS